MYQPPRIVSPSFPGRSRRIFRGSAARRRSAPTSKGILDVPTGTLEALRKVQRQAPRRFQCRRLGVAAPRAVSLIVEL
jgi:hypothetical protein